jgi:HEAT repeat protein
MVVIEQEILEMVRDARTSGKRLNRLADQFRSGRDVQEVLVLLESTDAELVSIGAWILGELPIDLYNTEAFISRLRHLLEHQAPDVRFHAFAALFPALNWRDDVARRLLTKLLNDPNEGVRRSAEAVATCLPANS